MGDPRAPSFLSARDLILFTEKTIEFFAAVFFCQNLPIG